MLSDLLKKYVEDTLEYFDKYSVLSIQLSSRCLDEDPISDQVSWMLSVKEEKSLAKDAIVDAVKKDWEVIGSQVGGKYRVFVDIQFLTASGAMVHYNDNLVITVGEDEDDSEGEETSDECSTSEDINEVLKEWVKAFKKVQEYHNKSNKDKHCCRSSIHSCTIFPDEDFL